jgi:putative PIN family toxin of toxin-antitoxin system
MASNPPGAVFDTSVLLSVAGRPETIYASWKAVLEGKLRAFTSDSAIAELKDVLGRPNLREHYGSSLDPANVDRFIGGYRSIATVIHTVPERFIVRADPKDSPFLNLAIESGADFLVTYDETHILSIRDPNHPQHNELLALSPGLKLVKPSELARQLNELSQTGGT